jgi:hypothetical protein
MNTVRRIALAASALFVVAAWGQVAAKADLTPERKAVLANISAESLKGNLSFLSSDLLEGRGTPSRGLDIAAEFIAAQFRQSGIEPAVGDSYFQMSTVKATRDAAEGTPVKNVIGILRGSDPKLKDTYVLVSAHYDHLGKREGAPGDNIWNGANDDGSGTVSVMEIANALRSYKPKRSIVFACWYGEERGLLGSRFYGEHPVFPLDKTVAMVNLEQVGRTDDTEGPRVGAASMTGEDYSDVGTIFAAAGKQVGVTLEKHPQYSDAYFGRSDNQALADLGIPAHTICTAFEYPDYHRASDTWDKVDYANMAKIDRMVALGLMVLADSATAPKWNASNPKTERYVTAWKKLSAK